MHVVINGWFYHRPDTGSGQYLHRLLHHLPSAGPEHRFTLLVPADDPDERPSQTDTHAPAVRLVSRALLRGVPRPLAKLWWEQVAVPRLARDLAADVLFVPYWAPPWWQPVPTVATVHDLIPLLLPAYRGGVRQRLYTTLVAAATRRCAQVITVSRASRRDVIARLGLPPERVHPVLHGPNVDPDRPPSQAQLDRVRARYGLPERYFLYLGGFDVRKNLAAVFRAYARYLALGGDPQVKLVIAGRVPDVDTPFFPDPRRLAREAGVGDQVHFIGWVEEADKPAIYRMAVALLFPSYYEGFGMMVLEAMAAGCPVITAR